ncbi:MAG: zinc-dependent peptidase [Deltaproteobacteria bacterium]|nr:MAG: zinc-dependent peptidase [Deltaproteobacteria bacterium]
MGLTRLWGLLKPGGPGLATHRRQILRDNVPLSRILPQAEGERLERLVGDFLDRKHFEGCHGLKVTEEMRVTVAGYACLLLLRDPVGDFPQLGTVVVYPESFAAPIRSANHVGIVTETVEERLGESWREGTVVLTWDSIREIIAGMSGDCNVIIHEFAHQIDARRGLTDGAPLLALRGRYRDWDDLLPAEQRRQRTALRRGRPASLDAYAFTSAEELFAVATECFYMRPVRFRNSHPELHAELQAVYGVDPAAWVLSAEC